MYDAVNPLVSVIIPTYNWSSVLPYSIGSVLRQTFSDFEVLVVGDGCTDDSETVVRRMGDPRVKWINLPTNTGHQSDPNNEGLRQAHGQYIAYLNHDDLWLPHHLSCLVSSLEQGADLAYGMSLLVEPETTGIRAGPPEENYYRRMWIPPTNVVHRRSITEHVGGWRYYRKLDTLPPDMELWLRIYDANYRFIFVPRLTAIKLTAAVRRDVYKIRPCHEQAAWSERIQKEKDFETVELIRAVMLLARRAAAQVEEAKAKRYSVLVREFVQETRKRLSSRLRDMIFRAPSGGGWWIDEQREFKGLERKP